MYRSVQDTPNPDVLRKDISKCREELLGVLQEWHYLCNILQPRLLFIYNSIFGSLEHELEQKKKNAAAMEKRLQLIQQMISRGRKLDRHTLDKISDTVTLETKKHPVDTNPGLDYRQVNHFDNSDLKGSNKRILPSLYRKIVKKLHPDVSDNNDYFNDFWYCVQDAYKNKNVRRLELFHQTLCTDENKTYKNEYSEVLDLRNEIRKLKMNIASEKRSMERFRKREPFVFEKNLENKYWIARRKSVLRKRISHEDEKISSIRQRLQEICSLHCVDAISPYEIVSMQSN